MGPDQALADLRNALTDYREAAEGDSSDDEHDAASRLADAAEGLDGWLSQGGLVPVDWRHPTTTHVNLPLGALLPDREE
jgi:hypothetical protein